MMVAISGIDGSGKTTVATEVVRLLNESGCPAIYSRPKYKVCKQFEFHLFQATGDGTSFNRHPESTLYVSCLMLDWLIHATDFLSQHRHLVMVLDRYLMDVLAQCLHFGGPTNHFEWFSSQMPAAELAFHLNVPPVEAYARLSARGEAPRKFESLAQLGTLNAIYDDLMTRGFPQVERLDNCSLDKTAKVIVGRVRSSLADGRCSLEPTNATHSLAPLCSHCDSYMYP